MFSSLQHLLERGGSLLDALLRLLPGVPLTLQLAFISVGLGMVLALVLAMLRLSGSRPVEWVARSYIFAFRSTPPCWCKFS